jgi:putative ABC transport system permease protein
MYEAEEKIENIFSIATFLTIFIALLGLLGLSSFIAEQKKKEIGIRKVVGASVSDILLLLYSEFLVLIMIAFVIAVPVAWWRIDIWLKDSFVYFQNPGWYTFLLAGAMALVVGIVTISYHILRAATSNPVDAIKYE